MNGFIRNGLCTILLGASSIVSGQSVKKDLQKNDLEVITEHTVYVSPDGNYSLNHDPKNYGLANPDHVVQPMGGYKDSYPSLPNHMPGVLVIESIQQSGSLRQLYDQYAESYVQIISNSMSDQLKPGQKISPVNTTQPKYFVVDNNLAIHGGVELLITDAKGDRVNRDAENVLLITLTQGKKDTYGFIFSYRRFNEAETQANGIYHDLLNGFHALK
jgi:hypothetical protein